MVEFQENMYIIQVYYLYIMLSTHTHDLLALVELNMYLGFFWQITTKCIGNDDSFFFIFTLLIYHTFLDKVGYSAIRFKILI